MCQTRIDFMLSLRDMECYLEDIYYKETGLSDHKMLVWKIDFNKEKKRAWGVDFKFRNLGR